MCSTPTVYALEKSIMLSVNGPIQTTRFTVDRSAYFRTMYGYNLWRPLAFLLLWVALAIIGLSILIGPAATIGGGIGLAIGLLLNFIVRFFRMRRNVYSPDSSKVYDDPRTMSFSQVGVHLISEGGVESQMPWSHIVKTVRRGGFTLLFIGKIVHLIVPDSAFASPADHEKFMDLLKLQKLV